MKSTPLLLLLALVLVVGLGAFLFLSEDSGTSPELSPTPDAAVSTAAEVERTSAELSVRDRVDEGGAARAERRESGVAVRTLTVAVALPAGVRDPELAVHAVERADVRRLDRYELSERLTAGELSVASAPVDARGEARLELPADRDELFLFLYGRYLFAERTPVPAEGDRVTLTPRVGACMTVALVGEARYTGVVNAMGGRFGGGPGRNNFSNLSRDLPADGAGGGAVIELRALDAELTWSVLPAFDEHFADMEFGLELEPAEDLRVELRPQPGAVIAGRVVDEAGEPVAEATVSQTGGAPWIPGIGRKEATTGADGRFALRALGPGRTQLRARREGWRPAQSDELELLVGQRVEGLVLTLSRGASIAGVVQVDGQPAAEAEVSVEALGGGGGWGGWGGARVRTLGEARTDAQGRFRVTGLEEGSFTVRAQKERDGGTWRIAQSAVPTGTHDLLLELSGPVPFRGRVVDDLGEPVTAFELELRSTEEGGPVVREEYTTEDGAFTCALVGPGEWRVSVTADGHVHDEEVTHVLPDAGDELVLTLQRLSSMAGRVLDTAGVPVAGADVRIQRSGQEANPWAGRPAPVAQTDEEGRFVVEELAPGPAVVSASAEAWADSEGVALELLPGTRREDVDLTLRLGGRIVGQVLTPEGDPLAGRRVTWGANAMGFGTDGETSSDAGGRFAFEHVTPGRWSVTAAPDMREMGRRMRGSDGQAAFAEIMGQLLTETVTVEDGEVVEVFLGGEPKQPVRVFGTVTEAGDPVSGADVFAVSQDSAVFEGMKTVRSGQDGTYELTVDRPGPYVFSARRGAVGMEDVVDVGAVEELRVDLAIPTGGIEGLVRGPDGKPAAGVRLSVQREDGLGRVRWGGDQAVADEAGSYRFRSLAPGTYSVRVNTSGWPGGSDARFGAAVRGPVEVGEAAVTRGVDFDLRRGGVVKGRVKGPDGNPIEGASLYFRGADGRVLSPVSTTVTDLSGRFEKTGLGPGDYTLSARADGFAAGDAARVTVHEGEDTDVELTLEQATTLVVTLEDASGATSRVRVQVFDSEGAEVGNLMTLEDMQALFNQGQPTTERRLGPLPPGRYTVRATTLDGKTKERKVTLRGRSGEKRVRIPLDED